MLVPELSQILWGRRGSGGGETGDAYSVGDTSSYGDAYSFGDVSSDVADVGSDGVGRLVMPNWIGGSRWIKVDQAQVDQLQQQR